MASLECSVTMTDKWYAVLWKGVHSDNDCEEPYRNLLENKKLESWLRSTIYQIYPDINILVTNRSAMSPGSLKFISP